MPDKDESIVINFTQKDILADPPELKLVNDGTCQHSHFLISKDLDRVECGKCGEKLNPMYVLVQLSRVENRYRSKLASLREKISKINKKKKFKCGHCGKFSDLTRTVRFRALDGG